MSRKFFLAIILIIIGVLAAVNFVLAWEVGWPEIPGTEFVIGDKCPVGGCPPDSLPLFIAYLFTFALIAAGMVALLMLVLGAVQYTASAAIPSTRVAARGRMTNAVLGLLLLFGTYVILNTINPELVMPGLGLSGTIGAEDLTIPAASMPQLIGVILYGTEDCSNEGRRYFTSQETLNHGTDDNWNNKAVAFEIFKMDDKIQFFREDKFGGEATYEITGPRSCTRFEDYEEEDIATSDFTKDISSLKFIYDEIGVDLCISEQPSEDNCRFFEAYPSETQPQLMEDVEYGNVGTLLTFYAYSNYDLCDWQGLLAGGCTDPNPYSPINDNESQWIDVPCGLYAILCKAPPGYPGTGGYPQNCYFLLESTPLKFWGDGKIPLFGGGWSNLEKETSFLMMLGYKDKYHSEHPDSDICKGVNFYTGKNFNRKEKFWGLTEESAGFPIGWGDMSGGTTVNLTTDEFNFTKVDDFGSPCLGDAGWWELNVADGCGGGDPYDISSLRMFGNCKLKIVEHGNNCGGASCEDVFCGHSVNDLSKSCQPMSEICSCIVPKGNTTCPCAGGSCAGDVIPVPPLASPCNKDEGCPVAKCCVGTNWDEDIESFILCNKDDDEPPCDFNCTF